MHITNCEDVNQETGKRNKQSVDTTEAVHCKTEVRSKSSYLNPAPQLINEWLFTAQSSARFEGKVKRNHGRNPDGATSYKADETLISHSTPSEPIDGGSGQRSEDD
jgi:hypothetical protein